MAALCAAFAVIFAWAGARTAEAGALRGQPYASSADDAMAQLGLALSISPASPEVEERVGNMRDALLPTFLSLPGSTQGYLEAAAVRYLLHRFFNDRDGWSVQGWDGAGEEADSSLPDVVLQGDPLARELSARLATRGLSLREVAVLATAVETLVARETAQRLHAAYRLTNLAHREDHATEDELDRVLQAYLLIFTWSCDYQSVTAADLSERRAEINTSFPRWAELVKWFHELRTVVLASSPGLRSTFEGQVVVLQEMEHQYGRWQNQECFSIKEALLKLTIPGTGRVPLNTFYSATLPGGWIAEETKEYLGEIGALDDSDPSNPSVVLPNYFSTPSTCAKPSSYYFVCCISECESLRGFLERQVGSPDAPPQFILNLVEHLPSTSTEVPMNLSAQLVKRLESIAATHGGHVPLHSRLFRQWMHHVYPGECEFPALSNSQKPRTPVEFLEATGHRPFVDEQVLQRYRGEQAANATTRATKPQGAPAASDIPAEAPDASAEVFLELPWSDDEELLCGPRAPPRKKTVASVVQPIFFAAIAASMVGMLARTLSAAKPVLLPVHSKVQRFV